MKFEIIDNRELDLKGKGCKWSDAPLQYDKTVLDDIRLTRGDDGELYSVLFDFGGDAPRPVFWSKVEAANE